MDVDKNLRSFAMCYVGEVTGEGLKGEGKFNAFNLFSNT